MRNNKNFKILAVFLFIILFSLFIVNSEEDTEIIFKWAFLQKNQKNKIINMDFSKDKEVKVTKNDLFKIYIQPVKNAYIYLFLYDSLNELSLIFPSDMSDLEKKYQMNSQYLIPQEVDEWFMLDENKGVEKFILLVSRKREKKLEDLTKKFLNLMDSKSKDKEKIIEAKQNVLDEIKNVKLANSNFIVRAEKPSPMAGTTRSLKEILQYVIEVKSAGFYERTFNLTHE